MLKHSLLRALAIGATTAALALPAVATPNGWNWTNESSLLPFRDGVTLSQTSQAQNAWLLSDGSHLYRFDGQALTDLTSAARDHGMLSISSIASDGRDWLITYRPSDRPDAEAWLYDGQTWTDVTGKLPALNGGWSAAGHDGQWYVQALTKPTDNQPGTWELVNWNGTAANPVTVALPSALSNHEAGCFTYPAGNALCAGVNEPVFVNGQWFFLGGTSEATAINGTPTQLGTANVWKLDGGAFSPIANAPPAKFVSGVWASNGSILLATSDHSRQPFAVDHLWQFDGSHFTDLTDRAAEVSLMTYDAREIHAAWNGDSWMILAGKQLIRWDGTTFFDQGKTKDLFQTISTDGNSRFVLGGAVSDVTLGVASTPLSAALALVNEDPSGWQAAALPVTVVAQPTAPAALPVPGSWSRDAQTGIQWLTWPTPNQITLGANGSLIWSVNAHDSQGLQSIEVWVNGQVKRTCTFSASEAYETCSSNLNGPDYPYGAEIFVNAKIVGSGANRVVWTNGTRIQHVDPKPSVAAATLAAAPAVSGPVFQVKTSLLPNVAQIAPGGNVTLSVTAQDNTAGLYRVDVYQNNVIARSCAFGAAVSAVHCDVAVDTSSQPVGAILNLAARAINGDGHEIWSNGQTLRLGDASLATSLPASSHGLNVWSWMVPAVSELTDGQTTTYTVGGWSAAGLKRIDIVVDGTVRRSCQFQTATGNQECGYELSPAAFSQGHPAVVNARVTDNAGHVLWSEPRAITMKQDWLPFVDPQATVGVTTDHADGFQAGDRIAFHASGWSANGVDHLDLFVNGIKVATCPTDVCTWISPVVTGAQVEYQARVVDVLNQETWTPLMGLLRK